MADLHWKTAITKIEPNNVQLRGYPIHELMDKISYAEMVYLVIKGELPSKEIGEIIRAILVSSVDHGASPPSVLSAITTASTGAPLNAAIASGILSISRFHGGAIEDCMKAIMEAENLKNEKNLDTYSAAKELVKSYREQKKKISGFGHRLHTKDPRTIKLFELTDKYNISGKYIEMARAIEKAIAEILGKNLPINVDGAIGAVLCELDFPPELANGFFIISRVPGLIAHVYEEYTRYKPMRRIHPTDQEYDGLEERHLV